MHARVTVAALAAGKHVYVEKPIATSTSDARRVLRAQELAEAKHGRRAVMAGFNYRFNPAYKQLRDLIHSNAVGDVVAVRSSFCTPARQLPGWKSSRTSGGGALLDLFSHHADLLPWLLDRPVEQVAAQVLSRESDQDTATVQLRFAGGVVGQCLHTISGSEVDEVEIIGTNGRLVADRLSGETASLPAQPPDAAERQAPCRCRTGRRHARSPQVDAALRWRAEPSLGLEALCRPLS